MQSYGLVKIYWDLKKKLSSMPSVKKIELHSKNKGLEREVIQIERKWPLQRNNLV